MYGPPVESQDDEISPWPSLLCPTMGARGLSVLLVDLVDVLAERTGEEEGLWTQTRLAKVELDGWSGLRPYIDEVLVGSGVPGTVHRLP